MGHSEEQIRNWDSLLKKVKSAISERSGEGKSYARDNIRQYTAFTINRSQFFTFDSIIALFNSGLYFYCLSLLRSLFESHITLWRICNSDIDTSKEFIRRAELASHNISVKININIKNTYDNYYDRNLLTLLELEEGYWDKPLSEFVDIIDKTEEDSWPYHGLMYLRLYSAGSEYIHPSSFSINESMTLKESENGNQVILFNPNLGIEAAWWSIIIIIDSEKWYRTLLGDKYNDEFADLKKEAMNLASEWIKKNRLLGIFQDDNTSEFITHGTKKV